MVNLHTAANFLRNRPRPILVAGLIAMVGALFLFGGTAAVSIGVIVIAMQAAIAPRIARYHRHPQRRPRNRSNAAPSTKTPRPGSATAASSRSPV